VSYEDQLIREATGEGLPSFSEAHEDYFSDETLEAEDRDVTNETGDVKQGENLARLAATCDTASQFIYKIQRDAIERDAPYNDGTFLAVLMQWAGSTPENQRRFKLSGWFGIANEYWDDSNLNSQQSTTAQP
jgi:hypothetical protein